MFYSFIYENNFFLFLLFLLSSSFFCAGVAPKSKKITPA